ncbi:MAG: glycoside hydrolase family 25 protein [Bacteroidaceae bacterium]|nr:glycoside hydrolase family 25 protein [Bacteroidaceae bacterium]
MSRHNGVIDWERVPAVEFVYIKATEGTTLVDSKYKRNVRGARARGFKVGAYHFFHPSKSATKQFENFRRHVKKRDIDLIPIVDVEVCEKQSRKQLQESLDVFIRLVKQHYGVAPMIYSSYTFYNRYCAPKFNRYHLMIARYGNNPPYIIGNGTYTLWQYTEKGRLKGIRGRVDKSRFKSKHSVCSIMMRK